MEGDKTLEDRQKEMILRLEARRKERKTVTKKDTSQQEKITEYLDSFQKDKQAINVLLENLPSTGLPAYFDDVSRQGIMSLALIHL